MADPSPQIYSLRVTIAGLTVDLQCPDSDLATSLSRNYQRFCSNRKADCTVQLEFLPGRSQLSLLDLPFTFQSGGLTYDFPGCQGNIDIPGRRAALVMQTGAPLQQAEYFLRLVYAFLAFEAGGLLVHAAAAVIRKQACLFIGRSGSGKSTIARLAGDYAVLNDDLVILLPEGGRWIVHGTPFWNSPGVEAEISQAVLAGVFSLAHDRRVYLETLSIAEGIAEMLASLPVVNADPQRSARLIQRCQLILTLVPCRRLHFLPQPSFWGLVSNVLDPNSDN